MPGEPGLLETTLPVLFSNINMRHSMLRGIVVITILLLCLLLIMNFFGLRNHRSEALPAITNQSASTGDQGYHPESSAGPPISPEFIELLVESARAKSVPAAPLKTILARLIAAGVSNAEMPARLLAAADHLEALRLSLAHWREPGPGHDQVALEALACVDRGDLDSASELLRRGREAYWTLPSATSREETEFYAMEAVCPKTPWRRTCHSGDRGK
jgi:hypothetical protein